MTIELLIAILSIPISVVLTLILQEPIHYWLASKFGRFIPQSRRIVSGVWKSEFVYADEQGSEHPNHHFVELHQFGDTVIGRTISREGYEFQGGLANGHYYTGRWKSLKSRQSYHGAFQLYLHPSGTRLEGKWAGFSSKRHGSIRTGKWALELVEENIKLWQKMNPNR